MKTRYWVAVDVKVYNKQREQIRQVLEYAVVRRRSDATRHLKANQTALAEHAAKQVDEWTKLLEEW